MVESYTRERVRRLLNVSDRQIESWEKQTFVPLAETYTFRDVLAMQALKKLGQLGVPSNKIKQAVDALRAKLSEVENPLSELTLQWDRRRISVKIGGQKMEALTGQLLLDFDPAGGAVLTAFKARPPEKPRVDPTVEAEQWFQRGLALEETGAPIIEVVAAYENAIQLNPGAAGALVNLGTIFFRDRKLKRAEACYLRAVEADPKYPLAQFNLGNLYDEQGKRELAKTHYQEAIHLDPKYADAFFNLALICEQEGETMKAISCWKTYLKLDPSSSWADIARRQVDRLKQAACVVLK